MMRVCLSLAALLLLTLALGVHAQAIDPYEGEVAVASQSEADRLAALPAALAAVFVKRTGDRGVADDPLLSEALTQASAWLLQYRYRNEDTATGAPAAGAVLIARFDSGAVDRALAAAGRVLWPEPRPQPVVWLVIDDGRGPRLLGSAQSQAVVALTSRARQRGLRLTYPLLDLEDQQQIDANRVWNADRSAAQLASRRYQSNSVLLGRLFREGSGWVAEWRVLQDGAELAMQRSEDADSAVVLAAGADLAANALAARYATDLATAGPPGRYAVRVAGISSAQDYARLLGQLRRMPVVRSAQVLGAESDALLLMLELSTGIGGFERSAGGSGLLQADSAGQASDSVLPDELHRFRLLP
jgi:hypothetical protein